MKYVDGYVIALPEENLPAYREMAEMGGKVWKRHGALEYFECVGEDLNPKPRAAARIPDCGVVLAPNRRRR